MSTDDREPNSDDRRPTTDGREPTADDREPTADDREPTTDDREPTADDREPTTGGDERRAVPKLPRSRKWTRLAVADLVRIAMFASLLVAVIVLREPCGQAVSRFFERFDPPPDAGPPDPREGMELIRFESMEDIERQFPRQSPLDAGGAAAISDQVGGTGAPTADAGAAP